MGFGDGIGGNRPSLELLMQRPAALGKVFFVDSGGVTGAEGTDPAHPLDSIQEAMDKCTASKGDTIVVMGLSPSTSEATEVWPIAMDVSGVLLTGLYSRGALSDSGFGCDEVDTACINVGANYVTIENLYLGIKTGSTTADVIVGTGSRFAFTLRNCYIEGQYLARYGFSTGTSYDFPWLLIEDNVFGDAEASKFTSAIQLFNATRGIIRRNIILHCSSYAIDVGAGCGNCVIMDNQFSLSADTDGFAIYLRTGSSNVMVTGNVACHGKDSPANDPFWVQANDDSSHSGINYEGIDATDLIGT